MLRYHQRLIAQCRYILLLMVLKTLEDPGNIVGVEDGAAIRLSVKVAREDTSENITQVKLTG